MCLCKEVFLKLEKASSLKLESQFCTQPFQSHFRNVEMGNYSQIIHFLALVHLRIHGLNTV